MNAATTTTQIPGPPAGWTIGLDGKIHEDISGAVIIVAPERASRKLTDAELLDLRCSEVAYLNSLYSL